MLVVLIAVTGGTPLNLSAMLPTIPSVSVTSVWSFRVHCSSGSPSDVPRTIAFTLVSELAALEALPAAFVALVAALVALTPALVAKPLASFLAVVAKLACVVAVLALPAAFVALVAALVAL